MTFRFFLFSLSVFFSFAALSQGIHPLEPASGHYKELQRFDANPNPQRSELDEIAFPPESFSSATLIYTMATPHYLTPGQIDELKRSITPPANSSDQTNAEIEFLLEWQEKRTSKQIERSSRFLAPIGYWPHIDLLENHRGYKENLRHLFYEGRVVLGGDCTPENYPATRKLLAGVTKDMRIMEFTVKYHLLRARPYHLSKELQPLARINSPSFASGHTLWAYIQAFTWSELVPSKRQEFLQTAYEVGESREIMGIHYPSDEEAARVLAHSMLSAMLENTEFLRDLAAAKAEWN